MVSTGGVGKWSLDGVQRGSRSCVSGHFGKVRASRRCWLTEPCEFVAAGRACNEFPGRAESVSDPPSRRWDACDACSACAGRGRGERGSGEPFRRNPKKGFFSDRAITVPV